MKKSFTLIEVIVGVALIVIVFLGIFGAYQLGLRVVGLSEVKIIATAIANAEIEKIRNLPYQSIGVFGSFPDGVLERSTTTVKNNVKFKIERRVDYVVDSADGIAPPDDKCPNDYKRVEIKVSWPGLFKGEVKLSTAVSPKNLAQECATIGGILAASVFNVFGQMVASPLIEIKSPSTGHTIKTAIPAQGKHYFSLAASTYKVVVSKNGYSSEQTFGSGDLYQGRIIITPEKPHPIVLEGQLTKISFSIDRLSSFSINSLSFRGNETIPIPNVSFNLRGAKIVGKDSQENPIYKYSISTSTDSAGHLNLPNLEWDNYTFSVDPATGLDLVSIDPSPQPIFLTPNTNLTVKLYLDAEHSLLVTVQNQETLEPIFAATVRLSKLGYDKTQYTNEKGQTYFIPLQSANYNLEVFAPGYNSISTTVSVSGDVTKTIKLEQIE